MFDSPPSGWQGAPMWIVQRPIHAIFKFVKPCLFCAQLFFGIHLSGLSLLFFRRQILRVTACLRKSPLGLEALSVF